MKTKSAHFLLVISLLTSLMFIWVEPAHACSCSMAHTPEAAFKEVEAVFRGKVVATFWPSVLPYNDKLYRWTRGNSSYVPLMINRLTINKAEFEVIDAWKGVDTTSIIVKEGPFSCIRTTFSPGSEYIVYAYGRHDQLWITGCVPSIVIEQSGVNEHLTYLEAIPKIPLKPGFFWLTFFRNLCFTGFLVMIIGIISVTYFARKRMVASRA